MVQGLDRRGMFLFVERKTNAVKVKTDCPALVRIGNVPRPRFALARVGSPLDRGREDSIWDWIGLEME